jgi:hypothetical protein
VCGGYVAAIEKEMEENNVWESDQLFYLWQHTGDIHLHLS